MKRIVVIGGMHGGAWIAARLKKGLRSFSHITFITPSVEIPLLPSVAQAIADELPVSMMNFRKELAHLQIDVLVGEITNHDPSARKVFLHHGIIEYDVLLVDPIMCPDFSSVSGAKEYAFTLSERKDAHELSRHISLQLHRAEIVRDEERDALRTIVITQSDVQGVHAALSIAHLVKTVLADSTLHPRIILCESTLPGLSPDAVRQLRYRLTQAGVVLAKMDVTKISANAVWLGKKKIPCNTVVWTGAWKQQESCIHKAVSVHVLPATNPYWPVLGKAAAKDAVTWTIAYLAGKPRPPARKDRDVIFSTSEGVLRIGETLTDGRWPAILHWWQQKHFVDL